MRARTSQIASPPVDPKMSFKTKIVSSFGRPFAKTHLIDEDGDRNLGISASSTYPTILQKTNVVSSFTEDLQQNSGVEKEGVIGFGRDEKKGAPEMKGYLAMYMKKMVEKIGARDIWRCC